MAYFWVYLNAMRRKWLFLSMAIGVLFLSPGVAQAQKNEVVEQVREAIKAGSAKELSKYLNQTVDVTIEGKLQNYSKAQAEFVLRDFFKTHAPNGFDIIHQGSSKGGQPFAIGEYKSGSDVYRVWMKIKMINKDQLIQEISFVKQ